MLLTVLGGTAVTIMTAFPAAAHDQLVDSDPKDGAELDEPVDTVTLTYSADLVADGTMVNVITPDGEVTADVTVDGTEVVADLGEQTAGGEYTVQWRVVSSDGHPIEGEFAYTVADQPEPAPSAEPSTEASESAPAASPEASEEAAAESDAPGAATPSASPSTVPAGEDAAAQDDGAGALPWIYGTVVVAAAGVALMMVARSRRRPGGPPGSTPQGGPQD
jgi:methionine-rich copper-binding protein CopC